MFALGIILANGNQDVADKAPETEPGSSDSKLKHQSVLQSKLTRLAIQIGYAGTLYCLLILNLLWVHTLWICILVTNVIAYTRAPNEFTLGVNDQRVYTRAPMTNEFTLGPPMTKEFTLGPPMTNEFTLGPPMTNEFTLGPPMTNEFTLGPPMTNDILLLCVLAHTKTLSLC